MPTRRSVLLGGLVAPLVLSRLPNLQDVPTADEFGFKGFEALTWWGCFGPSGVSKEISERFGNALADTLRDPPVNRQLSETLQIKFDIGGRDRLRSFLATQMRTWGAVVRENDIKAE